MAKAKAIIKRRKAVLNTRKITRTMELVSTAKFKQSFNRVTNAQPYRDTLQDMMADVAAAGAEVELPLLARRDPPRHVTVLLLTSNRGLCGSFNSHLCRKAIAQVEEHRANGAETALHAVGKKGISFLRFQRVERAGDYVHFGDKPSYQDVETLANRFIDDYAAARTDRVIVVYQRYVSAGVQRPWADVLLPVTQRQPEAGAAAAAQGRRSDYVYSPSAEELLRELLPAYFKTTLYHVFLENVVGEHRARMVAMKNATDNAEEMSRILTRKYNRARQSQITSEISEIIGGAAAVS
jgi:F-type H+-transporting ATPase subunit gamma